MIEPFKNMFGNDYIQKTSQRIITEQLSDSLTIPGLTDYKSIVPLKGIQKGIGPITTPLLDERDILGETEVPLKVMSEYMKNWIKRFSLYQGYMDLPEGKTKEDIWKEHKRFYEQSTPKNRYEQPYGVNVPININIQNGLDPKSISEKVALEVREKLELFAINNRRRQFDGVG
jgi:hypothetical protein